MSEMLRVFIGYDPRQPIAANVLQASIQSRASRPVAITRLQLNQLPMKRTGLTEFTFSRYAVPHLCGYSGRAIFMDADMLCLDDIYKLDDICAPQMKPVCVVKHDMRFEWPSLMYFNNAHCKNLTLKEIEEGAPHKLEWANSIGDIPAEWGHLVGYDAPRAGAKIVHFTCGLPCFEETKNCEYSKEWMTELKHMNGTVSWQEIMGKSVHARHVLSGGLKVAA
jgi:hypothetical protein